MSRLVTRSGLRRVVVYKLSCNDWISCGSGYLSKRAVEVGKKARIGSLVGRQGCVTSEVVSVVNTDIIQDSIYFQTKSGSSYLVVNYSQDAAVMHVTGIDAIRKSVK